ncbi:gluconokinase [Actinotalea sp. K2]|uniref:gluconokinase n=1 Tax=Actinotalea sp. K2 TaxID=2939438 RepID=UPI0020170BB6|nr:gluconokinase [Actinotalea sp. K2]MCL3863146.1 gluconokinase [Actinotalea sp. K2]
MLTGPRGVEEPDDGDGLLRPPIVMVMGVSGSGKSTVGQALAERTGSVYADADDFHSPECVATMAAGIPLGDEDRWPWLARVGAWLAQHEDDGAVIGCSALRRTYRDLLRKAAPRLVFVHLDGDRETLVRRLTERPGHFMPASLLDSQLATLEPLDPDEPGWVHSFEDPVERIVEATVRRLGREQAR